MKIKNLVQSEKMNLLKIQDSIWMKKYKSNLDEEWRECQLKAQLLIRNDISINEFDHLIKVFSNYMKSTKH